MASQLMARAGRAFGPVREARGVPRWIVWAGIVLTLLFVVVALTAPWISPYDFDQYKDASRFRTQRHSNPDLMRALADVVSENGEQPKGSKA